MRKDKIFENSWTYGDFRHRITAMGINGKRGWINVEYDGQSQSFLATKSLIRFLSKKHSK